MSTCDIKHHPHKPLITKSTSHVHNSSDPDGETAALHVKRNKADSVNNRGQVRTRSTHNKGTHRLTSTSEIGIKLPHPNKNDDDRIRSARLNDKPRFPSIIGQRKPLLTPHAIGEPQEPPLIKTKNNVSGPGRRSRNRKPPKTSKRNEKSPSLKRENRNLFPSIRNGEEVRKFKNIKQRDEDPSPSDSDDLQKPL